MNIRNTILGSLGALALGLASPEYARADEPILMEGVPEVTRGTIDEKTKEGYSVVLVYGSLPSTDNSASKSKLATKLYSQLIDLFKDKPVDFYIMDTQKLVEDFASSELVSEYLESKFGFKGRPSIMIFCDGEKVYHLEGSAPKEEQMEEARNFLFEQINTYSKQCR